MDTGQSQDASKQEGYSGDLFSLEGKTVVLTGGSGYLGSAMTQGLLRYGAEVVVADIAGNKHQYNITRDEDKSRLFFLECNLSNTSSIKSLFKDAKELCGKIDVLINNATYGALSPLERMTDEDWKKGVDGSVGTTFRCTREVIPYFQENKAGVIVNIGSMYGVVSPDPRIYGNSGQNNPVNYGVGKAGVIQLTKYCAAHFADKNIRVNCIIPGPFPNPEKMPPEDFVENLAAKTMLGRIGKAEEIVGAVIFLSSKASSYITGSNIVVDGGWTAW